MRDSGQLFLVAHQGMVAAGLDVDAVYRRFGYNAQKLELHGGVRTPHQQQATFWESVEAITGDADIGLHLCRHLPLYRGEIIEYLMFSSPTFGEGLERAFKYLRLVSDALSARLVHDKRGLRVCMISSALCEPQSRHTEICIAYEMLQFAASVTGGQAQAQRIRLRCPRVSPQAEYDATFDCPVSFGAEETELWFDPAILAYRSPHWDPDLLRLHEDLADKRLASLERQDLIARIRTLFSQRLELQRCELEDVATELGLSPRRLRFELTQAGTSFSQLLMEFRYALARRLLGHSDERIENIVYLTGFSEPSTFYRAFKRWSGLTPVQYRQQKQQTTTESPAAG